MLAWFVLLQGMFQGHYSMIGGFFSTLSTNSSTVMPTLTPFFWHAHEMIYGYACAVIAGFLLTAVKTWTQQPMPYGWRLLGIFLPWGAARILWLSLPALTAHANFVVHVVTLAAILDIIFWLLVTYAVILPIFRVRQKRQVGIVAKLILLLISQSIFYFGVFYASASLQRIGLYLGFYLIIGVVLTIGRRVIPMFIERGVDEDIKVKNSVILDAICLGYFLLFMLVDVFYPKPIFVSFFAGGVAVINLIRLFGWHAQGIWHKPLLWSLYAAFLGICLSFILFAIQPWLAFSHSLPVHGLALSGIGLMTLAMMARVSLGHTGRSIHEPPATLPWIFGFMLLALVVRVLLPLFGLEHYLLFIAISQIFWIISFILFICTYAPVLLRPRTDGLFG